MEETFDTNGQNTGERFGKPRRKMKQKETKITMAIPKLVWSIIMGIGFLVSFIEIIFCIYFLFFTAADTSVYFQLLLLLAFMALAFLFAYASYFD